MALPQAVERLVEEAETLQKQLYETAPVVEELPPVEQPVPSTEPQPPQPSAEVIELPKPAEPVKAVVQPPAEPPEQDAAYWKKRFETVQGKLNAEIPALLTNLRELETQNAVLRTQIENKNAQPPAPAVPDELVTQKDIDDFGSDLIDAMRRTAREEARKAYAAEKAALEGRFGTVDTRVSKVEHQAQQTIVDNLWAEVSRMVPDWSVIDKTPEWISWLDTSPEFSTMTYRDIAAQAIAKGDAQRIAKMVDTWKKETGNVQPTPPEPIVEPIPQPQPELLSQVAPSTVKSGAVPVSKEILTRAQYEALYDVRNVQRYGQKKADEMTAKADLAVAEGRVQW